MLEYEFENLVSNQNQSNNEKKTKKKKKQPLVPDRGMSGGTFSPGW
jgi:hypothetical protein